MSTCTRTHTEVDSFIFQDRLCQLESRCPTYELHLETELRDQSTPILPVVKDSTEEAALRRYRAAARRTGEVHTAYIAQVFYLLCLCCTAAAAAAAAAAANTDWAPLVHTSIALMLKSILA